MDALSEADTERDDRHPYRESCGAGSRKRMNRQNSYRGNSKVPTDVSEVDSIYAPTSLRSGVLASDGCSAGGRAGSHSSQNNPRATKAATNT
jgi:hypothetical protein